MGVFWLVSKSLCEPWKNRSLNLVLETLKKKLLHVFKVFFSAFLVTFSIMDLKFINIKNDTV